MLAKRACPVEALRRRPGGGPDPRPPRPRSRSTGIFSSRSTTAWGHPAGDRALEMLGSLLASRIRPGDPVARLGGEFVILLRESDLERARAVCGRIRASARAAACSTSAGSEAPVSLSMGLAVARVGERYEALAQRADSALYEAKHAGRNALRWAA
ncbi:GGDEF domain-containing protein [Methylobacterium sp. A52T]